MSGFVKLFGTIIHSSIWSESSDTKVVWVTMLALADRDGVVEASEIGLAKASQVSNEACRTALAAFQAPDRDSKDQTNQGRRVERIRDGWRIINYEYYRDRLDKDDRKDRATERQRRSRERRKVSRFGVTECDSHKKRDSHDMQAQAQAQTQAQAQAQAHGGVTTSPRPSAPEGRQQEVGTQTTPAQPWSDRSDAELLAIAKKAIRTGTKDQDRTTQNEETAVLLLRRFGRKAIEVAESLRFDPTRERKGMPWPDEVEAVLGNEAEKDQNRSEGIPAPASANTADPYSKVMERIIADRGWHACAAALEMPIKSAEVLRETLTDNRALGEILIDKLGEPSDAKYLEDATT